MTLLEQLRDPDEVKRWFDQIGFQAAQEIETLQAQIEALKQETALMAAHQGKPNPSHGKYYFVGRIPAACYDQEKKCSKTYDTEELAIQAAIDAGATRIQDSHCKFVFGK